MSSADTNLNVAECLKDETNFGETIVHNVCKGSVTTVPWGSADWAACIGVTAFATVFILMLAGMAIAVIRDRF